MFLRWRTPTCACGCLRPAREIAGYSTACWNALGETARVHLTWVRDCTEPIDSLEQAWALPARAPREAA